MRAYVITANNNRQQFSDVQYKGGADTYSVDLSPWVDDNAAISTATWTVESGQIGLGTPDLTDNVASVLLTFSEAGGNLVKVVCDSGTEKYVVWIDVLVRNLARDPISDSGYY